MGAGRSIEQLNSVERTESDYGGKEIEGMEANKYTSEKIQKWFNCDFPVHISAQVFELKEKMTTLRRHFHKYPELAYKEYNTAETIADFLRKWKFDVVTTGIAKTGVVGLLQGDHPGSCILLRVIFLFVLSTKKKTNPIKRIIIQKRNEVDYKSSKEGIMHACGHDCHMAILLGTAEILSRLRSYIHGSIKFVFQPAEEGGGGAKKMIEEGVLENPRVDQVYGLHVWSYAKFGTIHCRMGPLMAGSIQFRVKINGVSGGYAAAVPDGTNDNVIVACAQLAVQLHSIVPRNISRLHIKSNKYLISFSLSFNIITNIHIFDTCIRICKCVFVYIFF
ncbi:amidohydrolase [Reticulomyxa filosa]|uniref:Amidohydrolase n=1 Tax=Reticulomyxa filosa TaxID=46433 RepID=X6MC81_RETFI|nr:amidohydrolase [Reticulomyxa filosa]|eukprot:ETO11047.1 amidohydrolase [Reticulomyxa filosa]